LGSLSCVNEIMGSRKGKGFSREELKEVGLSFRQALKLGIPIDSRRSTKHKENIEMLKTYARELKLETPETEERRERYELLGFPITSNPIFSVISMLFAQPFINSFF